MDEGHDQARLPERHEVTHQRLMGKNFQLGYDVKRAEDEKKGLLRLYEEMKKSYLAANDECDQWREHQKRVKAYKDSAEEKHITLLNIVAEDKIKISELKENRGQMLLSVRARHPQAR